MWASFPGDKHIQAVIELITATQTSERVVAIVGGSLLENAVENHFSRETSRRQSR